MYWNYEPANATWEQCQPLLLQWWQITNSSSAVSPPFTFTFYIAGYQPYLLNVGNGNFNGSVYQYQWTVNIPVGDEFQVSLTDSKGAPGGDINYVNVTAASPPDTSCTQAKLTGSSLTLSVGNNLNQCANVSINVIGGTAPYTFSAVEAWLQPKVVHYSGGSFTYVLDAAAGTEMSFAVTDSKGKGAVGPKFVVGNSTDSSCLTAAATVTPQSPALTTVYPASSGTHSSSAVVSYRFSLNDGLHFIAIATLGVAFALV